MWQRNWGDVGKPDIEKRPEDEVAKLKDKYKKAAADCLFFALPSRVTVLECPSLIPGKPGTIPRAASTPAAKQLFDQLAWSKCQFIPDQQRITKIIK
ncbi:hypothetical protein J0S82_003105 [Galemys pyrenaicus]|uniref:Uncharacterized protein n=1 Tax=Galemys pyrenaicus TaxID=202257 RepID=A0A8J5ZXC1_GALPY|nr:hypothetical protein J0S82_003105 [Galemys pyrenaicus]